MQNVEDAEEVTQDVFVNIYKYAEGFKSKSKVSTWIYRITVNTSLNLLDKHKRRVQITTETEEYHSVENMNAALKLENQEKYRQLFKMIHNLPQMQRSAIILAYVEGLPQQEIAEILGKSLKSIESLLQRAKKTLSEKLNMLKAEKES